MKKSHIFGKCHPAINFGHTFNVRISLINLLCNKSYQIISRVKIVPKQNSKINKKSSCFMAAEQNRQLRKVVCIVQVDNYKQVLQYE